MWLPPTPTPTATTTATCLCFMARLWKAMQQNYSGNYSWLLFFSIYFYFSYSAMHCGFLWFDCVCKCFDNNSKQSTHCRLMYNNNSLSLKSCGKQQNKTCCEYMASWMPYNVKNNKREKITTNVDDENEDDKDDKVSLMHANFYIILCIQNMKDIYTHTHLHI